VIVSFAIFWVVKGLSKLQASAAASLAAPGPTPTEALLTEIRDILKQGH